jgi:hypothetical protein
VNARDCARAVHQAISRLGGGFMVDPAVAEAARRLGLTFFEFYVAGRAGVLGPVPADQVAAELPLLAPNALTQAWVAAGRAVPPQVASAAYAECNRRWGRARLRGSPDTPRVAVLAETVVDGLPLENLPLVAGWRALPRPDDPAARAAHLLQTLREYRGALHGHAVADVGLSPLAAIVAGPDGPARAALLGWREPMPDPRPFVAQRRAAEERTDDLAAGQFAVLSPGERCEFVSTVARLLSFVSTHDAAGS